MIYVIDYCMVYDADSGVLRLLEEEDSFIQLSNQTSRLLSELIKNRQKVVPRDELVKSVWEDYGFSGSTISVNVALSELRKAFKILGRDPGLIQTIRRRGLCFTASVEPVLNEQKKEPATVSYHEQKAEVHRQISVKKWLLISTIVVLNIISIIMFYLIVNNENVSDNLSFEETDIRNMGTYKKCNLFLVGNLSYDSPAQPGEQAKKELSRLGISCEKDSSDIYYSTFDRVQIKRTFISICNKNESGDYISCMTSRYILGE
ncbi:winged helix-turn-helix domain-containing protein [Intestinirhabdus alba]|jgi:DNA-binding winged helix-turn-helix (wHTH) protein|nr:winged helix-turn-helix domain-containing protein [Intestinirhabdus alba]